MFTTINRQSTILRTQISVLSLISMLLDPMIVTLTLLAAAYRYEGRVEAPYVILCLIAFSLTFPGRSRIELSLKRNIREITLDWLALAVLMLFFGYASSYLRLFDADALLCWFIATPIMLIASHEALRHGTRYMLSSQNHQRHAVVVGMGEIGLRLSRQFNEHPYHGIHLLGFFDDRNKGRLQIAAEQQTLLGDIKALANFVRENRVDLIYITLPMATQPRIMELLDELRDTTASIYFAPDIFLTDLIQGRLDNLGGMPLVAVCESPFTGVNGLIKHGSDIVLSCLILLLISPILLLVAIGVKRSSPGPILFRQRRYGIDGQEIVVYKFRSMSVCEDGAQVTQATRNDQRITPFGAFLRRTSLDELPQFINVLQGRMSIVGPRPHAVAHNELYRKVIKGYMVRHKVKPGITGLAQVNGYRGETDTLDKMQKRVDYDLEYLRNWSLSMDLWIILKTALVCLNDRHAY
mgnify:CR=1 FL=1